MPEPLLSLSPAPGGAGFARLSHVWPVLPAPPSLSLAPRPLMLPVSPGVPWLAFGRCRVALWEMCV